MISPRLLGAGVTRYSSTRDRFRSPSESSGCGGAASRPGAAHNYPIVSIRRWHRPARNRRASSRVQPSATPSFAWTAEDRGHDHHGHPIVRRAYLSALTEALSTWHRRAGTRGESNTDAPTYPLHARLFDVFPALRDTFPAIRSRRRTRSPRSLRTIALERTGVAAADSGAASFERQLASGARRPTDISSATGADSRATTTSLPRRSYACSTRCARTPAFKAYYDALPIAGVDGIDPQPDEGNRRAGQRPREDRLVAHARSLSGYVTTADDQMLILVCSPTTGRCSPLSTGAERIAVRLAGSSCGARNSAQRARAGADPRGRRAARRRARGIARVARPRARGAGGLATDASGVGQLRDGRLRGEGERDQGAGVGTRRR